MDCSIRVENVRIRVDTCPFSKIEIAAAEQTLIIVVRIIAIVVGPKYLICLKEVRVDVFRGQAWYVRWTVLESVH